MKKKSLNIILAVLVAEILMILLITLAQEILVDGVKIKTSPLINIVIGGTGTLIAGVIAGLVATIIVKNKR